MGVIAKRPIANVAWRYARKPAESVLPDLLVAAREARLSVPAASAEAAVSTALRFTLCLPGVHTAIVGTTKPERWQGNAALLEPGRCPPPSSSDPRPLA